MSYLQTPSATDGFMDWLFGGSGTTGVTESKVPKGAADFIKLKSTLKQKLADHYGVYKNPDGSRMTIAGSFMPQLPYDEAVGVLTYFQSLGAESVKQLKASGKSISFLGKYMSSLDKANQALATKGAAWKFNAKTYSSFAGGRFLPFEIVHDLWDKVLGNYVIEASTGIWASYNIESASERALWAIKDSIPGPIANGIGETIKLMALMGKLLKWTMIGGVVLLGAWGVKKVVKARKP
jgi:hypothetical protein